jgi:hypothetical protein
MKLEFPGQTFQKYLNTKFHENSPMGAELFHANRRTICRTDMTKLIVAFRNFADTPKYQLLL